jgi:hypothetical protein
VKVKKSSDKSTIMKSSRWKSYFLFLESL